MWVRSFCEGYEATQSLRPLRCHLHRQHIRVLCTWGLLPVAAGNLGRNESPVRLVPLQRTSFELRYRPLDHAKTEREHDPEGGQGCGRDTAAQRPLWTADGHWEQALGESQEDREDRRGHVLRLSSWLLIYAATGVLECGNQ